jgi:Family of unknown function (DUF5947)
MCRRPIATEHSHVVNVESRSLLCACRPCYLLFTPKGAAQGKYRAVPDRHLRLVSFQLNATQWERLQIPVGIAFFFFNSTSNKIAAFYPSPAGATESLLTLDAWQEIVDANPLLNDLAADVEALLLYRKRGENRFDSFIVPIDACYELTGIVRRYWKGFDGGEEAWREIDSFYQSLHEKSPAHPGGAIT